VSRRWRTRDKWISAASREKLESSVAEQDCARKNSNLQSDEFGATHDQIYRPQKAENVKMSTEILHYTRRKRYCHPERRGPHCAWGGKNTTVDEVKTPERIFE
jgi:hypothetical protein